MSTGKYCGETSLSDWERGIIRFFVVKCVSKFFVFKLKRQPGRCLNEVPVYKSTANEPN